MPVSSRVTVTTTATRLDVATEDDRVSPGSQSRRGDGHSVAIRNTGAVSIFWGGAGVTAAAGFELAPGKEISMDLKPGDDLWAITASGSAECQVAQVGV